MRAPSADLDLLFGLLAVQLNFLSREQLRDALRERDAEPGRPLPQFLRARGLLSADDAGAVEALVRHHLGRHGQDVKQALASLPTFLAPREEPNRDAGSVSLATVSHSRDDSNGGPPAAWPTESLENPTPAGRRFHILRAHARGGLGQVSVALDGELNREVALKEIQPQYADDAQSRARFLLEAEVTDGLEHPGVVPVYSLGKHADGRPFYAMRLIRGDSLKGAIDAFHRADVPGRDEGERTLALRQLLGRFVDVCEAIAYAHSRGVLHRDLKPGNVMLGPYGETLVVDWGLAKPLGQRHATEEIAETTLRPAGAETPAQTRGAVGTPAYMSPEQAAGEVNSRGPASDVYSLGATLYALLTGKAPFEGGDVDSLLRRVKAGDFPAPRKVKPQVPPPLEAVCRKAMALKPEGRYGSAKELAADVEHWLAGEPVKAWPEPWRVRAGRWLKRHRTLVTSGVAALAVAALVLTGATVLLSAAYENERAAKEAAETAREQEAAAKVAALAAEADARTQRDEALKQRQRAEASFGMAQQAVDNYLSKVTDYTRLKEYDFRDLRGELLKTALPFYEDLRGQAAGDSRLEALRGGALWKLAFIRTEMGEMEQAVRDYEEMGAIFARLAAAHPGVSDYGRSLAGSHHNRGLLFALLGRRSEAEAALRTAVRLQGALAAAHQDEPVHRLDLARSHTTLGGVLADLGRRAEAGTEYRQAIALFEALAKAHPDVPERAASLARSYNNLGLLLDGQGRPEEAKAEFRKALRLQQDLARDYPGVPEYRQDLANSHHNLGSVCKRLGLRAEAEAEFRQAVGLQQALARDHPTVPEFRRGLARSHGNLGNLLVELGKRPEAEAEYRKAVALGLGLVQAHPTVPDYRQSLARDHTNLGIVLADLGRRPEAEAEYRKAVALQEALARDHPAVPDYRRGLANSHNNLGNLLTDLGRLPQAEAAYRVALRLRQELAKADPTVPEYRRDLATSYHNRGNLLDRQGKLPEADAEYREAIRLRQALAEAHPERPDYRRALAGSQSNRGGLLERLGRPAEAEAALRTALKLLEALTRDHPAVPGYRVSQAASLCNLAQHLEAQGQLAQALAEADRAVALLTDLADRKILSATGRQFLGNSHGTRAVILNRLKRPADAAAAWVRAAEFDAGPNRTRYRLSRALVLARSGDHAQAAAAAAELLEEKSSNALYYGAAQTLALCAAAVKDDAKLREKYAARAVALLAELHDEGYFASAKNAARLKADPDLAPLRQRADLRKLLDQIEKAP